MQNMLNVILTELKKTIDNPSQGAAKTMDVQFVLCGLV